MSRFKLCLPYLLVSIALFSCKTQKKKSPPPPPPPALEIGTADCAQKLNLFELPPPEPLNSGSLVTTKFSVENLPVKGSSLVLAKILAKRAENADFVFYKACQGTDCYEAILRELAPDEDNPDNDIDLVAALDGRYPKGQFEASARSCVWADLEASPKGKTAMSYANHKGRKFYCGAPVSTRFIFPGNNSNFRSLFERRLVLADTLHENVYRFKDGLKAFQNMKLGDKLKTQIDNIFYLRDTYNLLVDSATFELTAANVVGAGRTKTGAGLGLAAEVANPDACSPPEDVVANIPPVEGPSEEQQAKIKELEAQAAQARQEAAAKEAEAKAAADAGAQAQAEADAQTAAAAADQAEQELNCAQRGEGWYWIQGEDGAWTCSSSTTESYETAFGGPEPEPTPTPAAPAAPAPEPSREEWRYAVGISLIAVGGWVTMSYAVRPLMTKISPAAPTGSGLPGLLKKMGYYTGEFFAAPATGFKRVAYKTYSSGGTYPRLKALGTRGAGIIKYSGLLAGVAMVTMGALVTAGVVGLTASDQEKLEALLAKWGPRIDGDKDAIVAHDAKVNEAIRADAGG